jgi:hypothetical protein
MNTLTGTLSIPNSVVSIGDFEFEATSLNTLILGSGLQSVGQYAFNLAPLSAICIKSLSLTLTSTSFAGACNSQATYQFINSNPLGEAYLNANGCVATSEPYS